VGRFASRQTLAELEAVAIHTVPPGHAGVGRRVYPGALQLSGFLSLDIPRHLEAHFGLWRDVVTGNVEGAERHRKFYDEYFAVMDLPAEFYLQTVSRCSSSTPSPGERCCTAEGRWCRSASPPPRC
jgi:poly(3-hydroxybutyrate) depolymerase